MTLPLTPEELKQYNNVPTTPLSQKLGDTIDQLVAGNAYQVADMAARNALTPTDRQVVRVASTGELFVYDASVPQWRNVPNSSTRPDFFVPPSFPYANGVVISVDASGDDANGEGTQGNPFATVSRALDSVPNGFENIIFILVAAGAYADVSWDVTAISGNKDSSIIVWGQGHVAGEKITVTAANTAASGIAHPSGSGNYASLRRFSFPTWTTAIPGPLPSMHPVVVPGAAPEYMLFSPFVYNVSGVSFQAASGDVVAPGSDNTTGQMDLVRTSSLFETGDYTLAHVSQLPSFPNLERVRGPYGGNFSIGGCAFGYDSFGDKYFPSFRNVRGLGSCFLEGGSFAELTNESVFQYNFTFNRGNYIRRNATNVYAPSVIWFPTVTRSNLASCYIKDTTILLSSGSLTGTDSFYDTSAGARPKLVLGADGIDPNDVTGSHAAIYYLGNMDMVGPGVGIQMGNSSVRHTASITFDGVSNPLTLTSNSYWGRVSSSALGTCTEPVIIGPMSMTGSGNVSAPTAAGIAGWSGSLVNTNNPGNEVQVGANAVTSFAALPQTDFALGNLSIGAVGK